MNARLACVIIAASVLCNCGFVAAQGDKVMHEENEFLTRLIIALGIITIVLGFVVWLFRSAPHGEVEDKKDESDSGTWK